MNDLFFTSTAVFFLINLCANNKDQKKYVFELNTQVAHEITRSLRNKITQIKKNENQMKTEIQRPLVVTNSLKYFMDVIKLRYL